MTSSHARPPNPDDLRRLAASAEEGGDADRDRELPLPPRRWRPRKQPQRPLSPPKVS